MQRTRNNWRVLPRLRRGWGSLFKLPSRAMRVSTSQLNGLSLKSVVEGISTLKVSLGIRLDLVYPTLSRTPPPSFAYPFFSFVTTTPPTRSPPFCSFNGPSFFTPGFDAGCPTDRHRCQGRPIDGLPSLSLFPPRTFCSAHT